MTFLVILWSIIAVSFILTLGILRTRKREKENEMMELYMLSVEMCYEVYKKRMEEVRSFRHDLAKHMQMLEYMMEVPVEINEGLTAMFEFHDYSRNQAVNSVL